MVHTWLALHGNERTDEVMALQTIGIDFKDNSVKLDEQPQTINNARNYAIDCSCDWDRVRVFDDNKYIGQAIDGRWYQ